MLRLMVRLVRCDTHCYFAALTEQGRLIEQGTHDELVRGGGLYAYLYSQQLAT